MDRNTKNDPSSTGKFGKLLAIGMGVALVWGVVMIVIGILVIFKMGMVISNLTGPVEDEVKVNAALSPSGQTLLPLSPNLDDDINLGSWPMVLGLYLIGCGVMTILFAGLGIYGGLKHVKFPLYMTIVFILITILFLAALAVIAFDGSRSVHDTVKTDIAKKVKSEYKVDQSNTFTLALNRIMLSFQCCGVINDEDFFNLTMLEITSTVRTTLCFQVPPACCIRSLYNDDPGAGTTKYSKIKECAYKGKEIPTNLHLKSCYDAMFDHVSTPTTLILVLIIIWDFLVLLLVLLAMSEIRPQEQGRESFEESRKEEIEEAPPIKKFVPYAKTSSFVHPDLSRIKSTEIW